ncbi:MAG TPA: hypothetical protein DDX54_07305, partial [Rhodospirillaceae bacterium]|nr:hypothetical protein [Rhodospirillaceae bacterium]
KRQEAIILSMTQAERGQPELLNMSRKRRIAAGSGTSVAEGNKLTKPLDKVQGVVKHLKRGGLSGLMGQMLGGDGPPPDMEALLAQAAPQPRPAPTKKKRKPRPKRVKRR